VGIAIGRGNRLKEILASMEMVAEGIMTTKSACALAKRHNVEMPITAEVYKVLFEDKDPRQALADLMMRQPKPELEPQ
jgi:glycerol-3-phosphate dehydrogenase (NAD(P)+)